MSYAQKTSVSVMKSIEEIRSLIQRNGGSQFALKEDGTRSAVCFRLKDRFVMFELELPPREKFYWKTDRYKRKVAETNANTVQKNWEQACRSHWRALALTVKSKFVSIELGVETFEEAFLAHVLVPGVAGNQKFSKLAVKYIAESYSGTGQPLLGDGTEGAETKH